MRRYSTKQAARLIGIHYITLHRWLAAGLIRPSIAMPIDGGRTLWRWTDKDVEKARKVKASQKPGPKPKKGARRAK